MDINAYGEERNVLPWVVAILVIAVILIVYLLIDREQPFTPRGEQPILRRDMNPADVFVTNLAATLKNLKPEGPNLSNIVVEPGIRAMDGEIPTPGEVKIMANLSWETLPGNPDQRTAMDTTAAHILVAIFEADPAITKIRLILKAPKKKKEIGKGSLGRALGHRSAAKVLSFTRAAYEAGISANPRLGDWDRPSGPAAILALGDYIVLTGNGWIRGY